MVFKGPGNYEVVPYQKPSLDMNSAGGSTDPGEKVIQYIRSTSPSDNARWTIAQVGGSGDQAEYIFINLRNGYLLTGKTERIDGDLSVTCEKRLPTDPLVRWYIKYSPDNGYETYLINGVNGQGQLNVKGASLESGAPIIYYPQENPDNARWYFDAA